MDSRGEAAELTVHRGPLDLPLGSVHVALVGISPDGITLFLDPSDSSRDPRIELELEGAFRLGATTIDSPAALTPLLERLLHAGVERVSATQGDRLEVELMAGDLLVAEHWAVSARDGRRWSPQPGGGIATWAPGGSSDHPRFDDARVAEDTPEVIVELIRPIELPGSGWVLGGMEADAAGRVLLHLEPEDREPDQMPDGDDHPDITEAFEFFSTLKVGPGTVPPDPDVLAAMGAAVEEADLAAWGSVSIALDGEPAAAIAASAALVGSLGNVIESVRALPSGELELGLADGESVKAGDWRVGTTDGESWTGSDRIVVYRSRPPEPHVSSEAVANLASEWLDFERTGSESQSAAYDRAYDVVRRHPFTGWLFVQYLIQGAADERQLMSVAAGPLEDLLAEHSGRLIDHVEAVARSDARTMRALGGVWQNSIEDGDWERIQALLGRSSP